MEMTPEHFLEGFVEWNLLDCREKPGDVRRGFNAAVSLSHLADHYFKYNSRHQAQLVDQFEDFKAFLSHLYAQTADGFRDVRSVSNAYKHLYNDSGPHAKYSTISSPGLIECIELRDPKTIGSIYNNCPATLGSGCSYRVVVKRNDGSQFELLPVMESVAIFFRELIYKTT